MGGKEWTKADREDLRSAYRSYWQAHNAVRLQQTSHGRHHWRTAEAEAFQEGVRTRLNRFHQRSIRLRCPVPTPTELGVGFALQIVALLQEDKECLLGK